MDFFDLMNAFWELVAGILVWLHVRAIMQSEGDVVGVSPWPVAWSVLWGVSSLALYIHLEYWASLVGNIAILCGNVVWLVLLARANVVLPERS